MKNTTFTRASLFSHLTAAGILMFQLLVASAATSWISIYDSDFTSDPGWTVTDITAYHWNADSATYTLTMMDGSASYATVPVPLTPGQSFTLEFDVNISSLDWAGNLSFGLFGPTRDAFPPSTPHPQFRMNFGKGDLGNGLFVAAYDAGNNYHQIDQYPSPFEFNAWYHVALTYAQDEASISVKVTRRSDAQAVWEATGPCPQGFGNLVNLGASVVGLNYSFGSTAIATIDNVALFESYSGTEPLKAAIRFSQVEICWPSTANAHYNVQYCSSLQPNKWFNLATNVVGSAGQTCVSDSIPNGQAQRFYRVQPVN